MKFKKKYSAVLKQILFSTEVDKCACKGAIENNWFKKFSAWRKAVFTSELFLGFYLEKPRVKSWTDSGFFLLHPHKLNPHVITTLDILSMGLIMTLTHSNFIVVLKASPQIIWLYPNTYEYLFSFHSQLQLFDY